MKHAIRILTIFLILSTLGLSNIQAKKYDFKLKLKKGEHFEYVFTSNDKVDQNSNNRVPVSAIQTSSISFRMNVINHLKNGNYLMEVDYTHFATVMNINGNKSSFDSDSTYRKNQIAGLLKDMNKIKVKYEITPLGLVSNLTGLEELSQKMDTSMRLSNLLKGIGTKEFITQLLNYFPKGELEPGAKWSVPSVLPELKNLKYIMNYTFAEANSNQVKFDFQSLFNYKMPQSVANGDPSLKMEETIKQDGNLLIDPLTNMPKSSTQKQVVDVVVKHTDRRTLVETTTPIKIITENTLKRVK